MGIRYCAYAFDAEMTAIAEDLAALQDAIRDDTTDDSDLRYVRDYLNRAVEFVTGVAASHRGFAYLIG